METIEKNKIIAQFMGANMIVENYHGINIIEFPNKKTFDLNGLEYHSNWNWLMQVVEKIESIDFVLIIKQFDCVIVNNSGLTPKFIQKVEKNKIDAVFNACLEFIQWYSSQKVK